VHLRVPEDKTIFKDKISYTILSSFLGSQPSLGPGLLYKIRLNFLEASQHFLFYRVELYPYAQPPSQGTRPMYLYPPEAGWLPILVASYDTHGLRWDYSYSPVTTRGI